MSTRWAFRFPDSPPTVVWRRHDGSPVFCNEVRPHPDLPRPDAIPMGEVVEFWRPAVNSGSSTPTSGAAG